MLKQSVTIAVGKNSFQLVARLDVDHLDPSAMPKVITGSLEYADGSVEEHQLHANDEKRVWFCENRLEYRLAMESPTGSRFIATASSLVS